MDQNLHFRITLMICINILISCAYSENIFEDGNHLYRFLEHDPVIMTQCYNIPRGMFEVKPKPVTEIASRLRFLSYAIIEAYMSEDGKHVDYWRIHSCEEFKRLAVVLFLIQTRIFL